MIALYLWINAALYAVFAALCVVRYEATSRALGYLTLDDGGRSEYLTVYGGLQVGLAFAFAWTAMRTEHHRVGVLLALALYAPIVLFRWSSIALHWPVGRMTIAVGALETTLLACALALWWRLPTP